MEVFFRALLERFSTALTGDCQEFRGGVAVEHQVAMARMKRSPNNTATTEK